MNFSHAEDRFRELKAQFASGDLTEIEFKAKLEELMVEDEGGNWWMLGYETERWYRYDGSSWVQQDPPGRAGGAGLGAQGAEGRRLEAAASAPRQGTPRRSPTMFVLAALVVLAVGGYFVFRSSASKAAPTPTADQALAVTADPTQTPTLRPEPTVERGETPSSGIEFFAIVSVSKVILYQGPDLRYGQVKSYSKGENFAVLARNDDGQWLQVSAADGNEGWVYFQWVDFDFDIALMPTSSVAPPPLPTPTRKPKDSDKPTPCGFGC